MDAKKFVAACAATLTVALVPAIALAAGTTVSVRVEGKSKTLLPAKSVHTHGGWITKGGAPTGACPATSAAGALDVATHHDWAGKFDGPGLGDEIDRIFKETHGFTSSFYWELFVNNRVASLGACSLKLHRGEKLLFAAVPLSGTEYPLVVKAPRTATAGRAFAVKVTYVNAAGKQRPLAGARVSGGGVSALTNATGVAGIAPMHAGTLSLHARHAGYIRAAVVRVRVLGAG